MRRKRRRRRIKIDRFIHYRQTDRQWDRGISNLHYIHLGKRDLTIQTWPVLSGNCLHKRFSQHRRMTWPPVDSNREFSSAAVPEIH